MDIGSRLRGERERMQMTQTQLAEIAGASKHAQIKWEKGDAYPNAAVLSTWAMAGMDVLYVLTGQRANVPTSAHLPPKEQLILDAYRAGTTEQRNFIVQAALGFSGTEKQDKVRSALKVQKIRDNSGVMILGASTVTTKGSKKKK